MRYLVVRTDVRQLGPADLQDLWSTGSRPRDERKSPETRRQTFTADNLDAALILARALASSGPVRSGKQRVKVVPLRDAGRLGA
jgi:hypothetical protein